MSLAICRSKLIGELTNEFYDLKLGLKQPLLTLRSCPRSIYSFFAESKSDFTGKKWPELQRWIGTTFRSNSPEFPRSSGIRRNSERILQPSLWRENNQSEASVFSLSAARPLLGQYHVRLFSFETVPIWFTVVYFNDTIIPFLSLLFNLFCW